MTVRFYSSTAAEATLSGTINSGSTTIVLDSVVGLPGSFPYTLALDYESASEELVDVTAASGTSLTVARAVDGTNATSHSAGARVRHVSSARDYRDSRNHENSNAQHGATGSVVGTTNTQTLTNKTMSSPVIVGSVSGNYTIAGQTTYTDTRAIRINNAPSATPTSTDHSFQIGDTAATNIRMDGANVQAVSNGVASPLRLQPSSGDISVFGTAAADSTAASVGVLGTVEANLFRVGRAGSASTAMAVKTDADGSDRLTVRADGMLSWGSGSAGADTNLFRNGANQLRTNDSFQADGNLVTLGSIVARNLKCGTAVTPAAGTTGGTTQVNVTFPAMASTPFAVCVPDTAANPLNTNIQWYITNITTTGFTITCFRSSNSVTRFSWIAMAV